jgi:tRNA pseudouridine55 synthase
MVTATPDAGGLLLVDKPAGMTSHDVVTTVRRAVHARRVGHTGTLDPFATGLLVVLVGRGTRLIPYVDGEPKVYDAVIRFGAETDTDDATGVVTRTATMPTNVDIAEGVARLTGEIDQMPPAYSAKKVEGTRAYDAARRGESLELKSSRVTVHRWTIVGQAESDLTVSITCSGGTYIRALARDLGRLSGSAAHLLTLRRRSSGPFDVSDAVTIEQLREGAFAFRPLRSGVASLPTQTVEGPELRRVVHGNAIAARTPGSRIALLDHEETLIAVAERTADELRPALVLRDE